jgi:kynurenine formamidase
MGTQLDPPAHWHQCFPAVDELPPTLALRKLAVISIADQVQADVNYALTADDVRAWEQVHGRRACRRGGHGAFRLVEAVARRARASSRPTASSRVSRSTR